MSTSWMSTPTPDASSTVKGKIQLAGDLGGTAAAPTVGNWNGWQDLQATPNTVTAYGTGIYDLVFNSNDLTDTVQKGMKLKLTRTVTAPTQCTDLESSSTQYYNKTSPNKLTFTDDFVCSAWIKLESVASNNYIISRYNGTSGWGFRVDSDLTFMLVGWNGGSGNFSYVQSLQKIQLGKWTHIAAQLDMSAFTATTTTSYCMIDGVDVPAQVARSGTNPTALIQAGNLEVGSTNGGTLPFDGKLAQVAVYSAKVTQATVLASIDRTLAGTETSLASAYSFNNSITDLNTTTPNDLTAQNSAAATNADSPFAGGSVGTTEYAEITSTAFSTNTTLSVICPYNNQIPTTGGVSAVSFSMQAQPYGWTGMGNITHGCILYKSTDQSTSSTGAVLLTFDGELMDTLGLHSRSSNTSRITIPTGYDGLWLFLGRVKFTGGTAGSRLGQLYKNGGVWTMNRYAYTATGNDHTSSIQEYLWLSAGDYIELAPYWDGGGTVTFQGGCPPDQDHSLFEAYYLGK